MQHATGQSKYSEESREMHLRVSGSQKNSAILEEHQWKGANGAK